MPYNLRESTKTKSYDLRYRHNYVKGVKMLSWRGNPIFQCQLGINYYTGNTREIPKNRSRAFFWFRKSAAQGFDHAIDLLSRCYTEGHGVEKDMKEGRRLQALYRIKCSLREILDDIPDIHEENEDALKIMMDSIYQFTGHVR